MNIKKITFIMLFSIFLFSCADYNYKRENINKKYYSSNGFALIYEESLYINKVVSKKIDNEDYKTLHNFLKKNTLISITNPENQISIKTKISSNTSYPNIFNIVINKKIAEKLNLDLNNPYVEILELKKNKTFVAKEGSIFDEERNVAEKVPVSEIKVDNISDTKTKVAKNNKKKNNFTILISDFYYKDSALDLKNELLAKTELKNIIVKEINNKKYRLLVGPFKSFKALKDSYIALNGLGFENLDILNK